MALELLIQLRPVIRPEISKLRIDHDEKNTGVGAKQQPPTNHENIDGECTGKGIAVENEKIKGIDPGKDQGKGNERTGGVGGSGDRTGAKGTTKDGDVE